MERLYVAYAVFLRLIQKTVTLLPQYFMSAYSQRYDNLFAALFIIMIPTIIIYISLQKYFEQGVVSGAIKQ